MWKWCSPPPAAVKGWARCSTGPWPPVTGAPVHTPVMARQHPYQQHTHTHGDMATHDDTHTHRDHGADGGSHTHTHAHTGMHTHTHPDLGTHEHPHTGPHAHAHPDEPLVMTTAPDSAAQYRS